VPTVAINLKINAVNHMKSRVDPASDKSCISDKTLILDNVPNNIDIINQSFSQAFREILVYTQH
jgi:hypothetical protein